MPFLDVTEILLDPDFAEPFQVLRRAETVNGFGEGTSVDTPMSAVGVITMASDEALDREPADELMRRTLTIITKFALRGPAPGYRPDIVIWNPVAPPPGDLAIGNRFVVTKVAPYSKYGPGFIEAEAVSQDMTDLPPSTLA